MRTKIVWYVIAVILLSTIPLQAQDNVKTITVAVAENLSGSLEFVLGQYEEQHPDIRIVVVTPAVPTLFSDEDVESRLDRYEDFIRQADLHVGAGGAHPMTTRAGYFLNMEDFTRADPTFDSSNYYPGMLASFQWDGGTWGLPLGSQMQVMYYDPVAFDRKGLNYPDSSWTVDDLREVAGEFASIGSDGKPEAPPIISYFTVVYLSMLSLTQPIFDPGQLDAQPQIDSLELESLFERWLMLETDGYLERSTNRDDQPLVIAPSSLSDIFLSNGYKVAPIPGALTTVLPISVSVNSGTAYPEQAYDLARFLVDDPAVFNALPFPVPGRIALAEGNPILQTEDLALLAEDARPSTDFLFFWYVFDAYFEITEDGVDVHTALIDAQARALDDLEAAANRDGVDLTVSVTSESATATGAIRFGVVGVSDRGIVPPVDDVPLWQQAASEFAGVYPDAAPIEIIEIANSPQNPVSVAELVDQTDCYYTAAPINTSEGLEMLLALDPLFSSDPDVDMGDFAQGTIAKLSRNDLLYGFPLVIHPQVIAYNIDRLEAQGVGLPTTDWTVADFEALLRVMRDHPTDPPVLDTRSVGEAAFLNLVAAYGAVPIDFRTDPPTIDLTSENSVNAIRQVLDLAKDGFVNFNHFAFHVEDPTQFPPSDQTALHIQFLNPISNYWATTDGANGHAVDTSTGNYGVVTFPQGLEYSAVDYDLGAAYITTETQHINPCFEFIKYVSERPDIFRGVPARRSVLNSDLLRQLEDEETIAFYNSVHDLMNKPNLVEFPYGGSLDPVIYTDNFVTLWLKRAMTRYLFEDADLEIELIEAQEFTLAFLECTSSVPPFNPENQPVGVYLEMKRDCFRVVDPTI